jgi:hypothetical protein
LGAARRLGRLLATAPVAAASALPLQANRPALRRTTLVLSPAMMPCVAYAPRLALHAGHVVSGRATTSLSLGGSSEPCGTSR